MCFGLRYKIAERKTLEKTYAYELTFLMSSITATV